MYSERVKDYWIIDTRGVLYRFRSKNENPMEMCDIRDLIPTES